jgi:hypothetical protein
MALDRHSLSSQGAHAPEAHALLGLGTIAADGPLVYRIPIPAGLDGRLAFRALTTTLAWFTPINLRHQGYRRIARYISPGTDKNTRSRTRARCQPTDKNGRPGQPLPRTPYRRQSRGIRK